MSITTTTLRNDDNETVTIAVINGDEVRVTFTTDGQVVDDRIVYSTAGRASDASVEDEHAAMEHAARLVEEKRQDGWR